ncbi:EF-hand calcium-binding domain-containing protein 14 isoform X3 [Xenopus tropicalis]|uniref:EF-hand calcium-binding domain-containing protein 14 isoform X3 n=1 Tax=Xenopus tropicalis TaxID=8364 RepID=A0A8J0R343_XENTR|nr:EF-hand calcium-binding domain-containing protein 14 isoform X3 [Xenopus tropicalis]|eukprot:XP_004914046.1 PREDICTED: EF-hand calcium-binding domain-containing protein 14 isoform X2 [Xenopus tropicalis]
MGSGALSAGPPAPPTPHKKMKKRKELNALIGLAGDGGRKKAKKGSGHRLLRTEPPASDSDTDTEEEDEFGSLEDRHGRFGRGSFLQCCKICYPLCGFVVLAACVVTCIGLVWMQVVLKENMDALKEKFRAMESNQKSSLEELPKINEDLLSKQKYLEDIMTGEKGLNKLWTNITEMNKQIAVLTSAVNHLKATIKSASELINLPNTMAELQKSVATLGNTLTSVHNDVETMQAVTEEQKKKVETLQKDMDVLFLQNSVDDMNTTLQQYQRQNDFKLYSVDSVLSNLTQRVALFEHELHFASKRENVSLNSVDSTTSPSTVADPANKTTQTEFSQKVPGSGQPSTLQQKLQLIHALTNQPEIGKQGVKDPSGGEALPSQTTLTRMAPRSVGWSGQKLPGISTEKDLEDLFNRSVKDVKGQLSYKELETLLGPGVPSSGYLKQFDADGDDLYSIAELKALLSAQQ